MAEKRTEIRYQELSIIESENHSQDGPDGDELLRDLGLLFQIIFAFIVFLVEAAYACGSSMRLPSNDSKLITRSRIDDAPALPEPKGLVRTDGKSVVKRKNNEGGMWP